MAWPDGIKSATLHAKHSGGNLTYKLMMLLWSMNIILYTHIKVFISVKNLLNFSPYEYLELPLLETPFEIN